MEARNGSDAVVESQQQALIRESRVRSMYLFDRAMKGEWDAVVESYTGENRRLKVSDSGDTAMHLAVRLGKTEHVKKMVGKIGDDEAFEILSIKNNHGNTVLHMAAGIGNVLLCCCIALKDGRLLSIPNLTGATPLFVSVFYGKKDAFFHLDFIVRESRIQSGSESINYSLYKREKGYTILHAAVFQEYFGLAIQIAELYPLLINFVDDLGRSPLHILANKYAAFKSGSFLRPIDRIVLRCINVNPLVEKEKEKPAVDSQLFKTERDNAGNHQQSYRAESRDIENNISTLRNSSNQGN